MKIRNNNKQTTVSPYYLNQLKDPMDLEYKEKMMEHKLKNKYIHKATHENFLSRGVIK